MKASKRIQTLCSLLQPADTFADVGCDHGYLSEYMLKNGLCKKAILSDISAGSLKKAEKLLETYIRSGEAVAVCGDGFYGVPEDTDEVVVAGMGGFEIVQILSSERYGFLPKRFLFQPMKDGELLRSFILEQGGYIERDFTFFAEGKFYDVICGRRRFEDEAKQTYTKTELEFGRENVRKRPPDFLRQMQKTASKLETYLLREVGERSRESLTARLEKIKGVISGEND